MHTRTGLTREVSSEGARSLGPVRIPDVGDPLRSWLWSLSFGEVLSRPSRRGFDPANHQPPNLERLSLPNEGNQTPLRADGITGVVRILKQNCFFIMYA